MKTNMKLTLFIIPCLLLLSCTGNKSTNSNQNLIRSNELLDSIYSHYSVENSKLLRENHPFNEAYTAGYLSDEEQKNQTNPYAYLWPFSGSLSAVTALYEAKKDSKCLEFLESTVLPGLEAYYDTRRHPDAYASYINTAPLSDRFYDDNVWLGLDFTDLYMLTGDQKYLNKAKLIWQFIESGTDSVLGGGIYWCEQKKTSKNTCSNAPGSVYALKLFEATGDSTYFYQGKKLYEWTKKHLQDPNDYLYYDNINLEGRVEKTKFAYNSGQMLQAASLLYKFTKENCYLTDAQNIASSAYKFFFKSYTPQNGGETFRLLKKGCVWFIAIMSRGYVELYKQDNNREYIDGFQNNLDYAWVHMRDNETGLFNSDWSGQEKDESKWLLTQFAMVEMYARMSEL